MKRLRVVFTPEAEGQLASLYRYVARAASLGVAAHYTEAIVAYCETLGTIPLRGTHRDDVRPGLRITHYKKRTVIAFGAGDEVVTIVGVFYGGQDYETALEGGGDE